MNSKLSLRMTECSKRCENALSAYFEKIKKAQIYPYIKTLCDSMEYSIFAGGKRLRPFLTYEFCKCASNDESLADSYACAIEMIHTYSLIHDDMPCMDDDDLRRGKPSNHKIFGEAVALLSGDALLTYAFETLSDNSLGDERNVKALKILSHAAGPMGMDGGQLVDLESENKKIPPETLRVLHENKTGALIRAASQLGCTAAGIYLGDTRFTAATVYSEALGLAFQITDDILDVVGDEKKLGKKCGSDAASDKTTYVTLYGLEKSKLLAKQQIEIAKEAISVSSLSNTENLMLLADYIIERDH